jgi:hypothetical protein
MGSIGKKKGRLHPGEMQPAPFWEMNDVRITDPGFLVKT